MQTLEERQRQQVMFGTDVLNRASESVLRTQRVAAENEEIGVEILGELGTQREQLQRTSRKVSSPFLPYFGHIRFINAYSF